MTRLNSILRGVNLVLLVLLLITAFLLVTERYSARKLYGYIGRLQDESIKLNLEYTKLQVEYGTYSSKLNLQSYALKNVGLIVADKQHVMELKQNVSK